MGKKLRLYLEGTFMIVYCCCAFSVLIIASMLFPSCSTHKKSITEVVDIKTENIVDVKKEDFKSVSVFNDISSRMDCLKVNCKFKIVLYDTDKPKDTETNLYPILAEINGVVDAENKTKEEERVINVDSAFCENIEIIEKETDDSLYYYNDTEKSSKSKIGRDLVAALFLCVFVIAAAILSKNLVKKL